MTFQANLTLYANPMRTIIHVQEARQFVYINSHNVYDCCGQGY
jgi:hypothetical protein